METNKKTKSYQAWRDWGGALPWTSAWKTRRCWADRRSQTTPGAWRFLQGREKRTVWLKENKVCLEPMKRFHLSTIMPYFRSKLDLHVCIIKINCEKQCFCSIKYVCVRKFFTPLHMEVHAFSCHYMPEFSQNLFNYFSYFLMTCGNPVLAAVVLLNNNKCFCCNLDKF